MRNMILGGQDWTVQPPDIQIEGTSGYDLQYCKNLAQQKNPFGKKSGELSVVSDASRLREAIGRPKRDHSRLLRQTIEQTTNMFTPVDSE